MNGTGPENGLIDILVIDDHPATARGIAAGIAEAAEFRVVGYAKNVPDARHEIETRDPDIVLCDIALEGEENGFALVEQYTDRERPRFLCFSSFDYPAYYAQALSAGAAGYLLKNVSERELITALRTVASGGTVFSASALRAARSHPVRPSDREIDVVVLVADGFSNDEIGTRLTISPKTVESHLRRLFSRYDLANRTELATLAYREGWIRPE